MKIKCNTGDRIYLSWISAITKEVVGGTIKEHYYIKSEEFEGVCFFIEWDKLVKDHFAYNTTIEPVEEINKTLFFSEEDAKQNLLK